MEVTALTLEELTTFFVSTIPAGFALGCIPMIIGVAIHGIIGIFKKA